MRWRCLGEVAKQLGNEDEAVTNPKPYDIPKRRVLVATRTKTRVSGFSVPLLKMGAGLPRSACRSWPQTASVLLCPKDMVVSDRGKGASRRQVCVEKMSVSEPSVRHRNSFRRCQNRRPQYLAGPIWRLSAYRPSGSRCIDGMSSTQASERGT